MNRFYYRFDEEGKLGNAMRKFWHDCIKADEAAERWARKFGGERAVYYQDVRWFAGSVAYLSFPEGADVNPEIWTSIGMVGNDECFVPNCKQRHGAIVVPHQRFRPSDTAHRMYQKRLSTWIEVRGLYTVGEWAEIAHIQLTGNDKQDQKLVQGILSHALFVQFTEFYGETKDNEKVSGAAGEKAADKGKMPWTLRKAIEAERQRLQLPVVSTQRLYDMLRAKEPDSKSGEITRENGHKVINTETPTFFNYGGRYYIGIDRECECLALEAITPEQYTKKQNEALIAERLQN